MANVFDVTDPRGRRVFCTEEIWYSKIGRKRSYMMSGDWLAFAKEAISHPSMGIFQDADHEDREIYYLLTHSSVSRYIKVVVKFDKDEVGRVVTVTPTNNGKHGEKLIWTP